MDCLDRTSLLVLGLGGLVLAPATASALEPFTDGSVLLNNPNLRSGVAIAVTDMNADGRDDIVRLDDAEILEIEYQQADGSFTHYVFGDLPGSQWALAVGDIDGNGYPDIFTSGSYNMLKILTANDTGDELSLSVMNSPDVFTQCANFADIDNNSTLDLFICHDDGISAPMNNDGAGNFTYDLGLINAASTVPSDNSGNYGSVWTDYDSDGDLDLYIAKCRLFVNDPMDGRRLNLLFENDGMGGYTDVAEAVGLRPGAQSWSADFGDIDNDGDMDAFLVNHDMLSQLYVNEGGTFVDITNAAGITSDLADIDQGIQAYFDDFDNDTFIDLLATGREGEHRLFINNGDHTFTAEPNPFPTLGLGIQSAVVGDLNSDGFRDIVAGFATGYNNPSDNPDRLFLNPGNDNNWLDVRLTGVMSNVSAVGARIELHGEWGVMVREVRAGEGYGITNSHIRHFGLGTADTIDTVIVRWPSGQVDTSENPDVLNEQVHIIEGCPATWYGDSDGDGFGNPSETTGGCLRPAGYVEDATDCDDMDGANFPGNAELCDGQDNNCNDQVDEDPSCLPTGSSGGETTSDPTATATATDPTSEPDSGSGGGPGGSGDDTAGSTTGEPGVDDGGGGCGSCSTGSSTPMGWTVLTLGLVFGLRRRRALHDAR